MMKQPHSTILPLCSAAMLIALAGCTAIPNTQDSAPPPAPPRAAAPPPSPVAPPALSWEQRALDKGAWRYDAASRTATFAQSGAPLLAIACAGSSVRMTTDRFAAGGQALAVDLKSSFGTTRLRFEPQGAQGSRLTLPAMDNKLDQIAFSRGRIGLDGSNGRTLTLPVHAEVSRVIEDCRG